MTPYYESRRRGPLFFALRFNESSVTQSPRMGLKIRAEEDESAFTNFIFLHAVYLQLPSFFSLPP